MGSCIDLGLRGVGHRTPSNDYREKGLIRLGLVRKDFCRHVPITGCFKGTVGGVRAREGLF